MVETQSELHIDNETLFVALAEYLNARLHSSSRVKVTEFRDGEHWWELVIEPEGD